MQTVKLNSNFKKENRRNVYTFSLGLVGLIVLITCLFYVFYKLYIIEKRLIISPYIDQKITDKAQEDAERAIAIYNKKMEDAVAESQKFSSLVISAMGLFISIITVLIIPVIAYFYKKSTELYEMSQQVNQSVSLSLAKIDSLMDINSTIQNEQYKTNVAHRISLQKFATQLKSEELKNFLNTIITKNYYVDTYKWCLHNSLSGDKELRHRALLNIGPLQKNIPNAQEYLVNLLNHYIGKEYEEEREIILNALGIKKNK